MAGFTFNIGLALAFFALALASFVSLARQKPWTANLSKAPSGQRQSPIFIGVNKAVTSLWTAIFLASGFLAFFDANPLLAAALSLAGALLSIFGPRLLVRAILARKFAAQQDFDWPAPRFDTPRGQSSESAEIDVAVIGAGLGGLTAACLLAAQGLRVKIYEQHVLPGGFCHSWLRKTRHDGAPRLFRFDAGPHDFSGAHRGGSLDRLLRRLGCAEKIEWLRHDYRIVDADGEAFDPPRDWRAHVDALARRHPEDGEGIRAFFAIMKALYDAIILDPALEERFPGPPASVDAMLAFAQKNPLFVEYADLPYAQLLSRHVRFEPARAALMAMVSYISADPGAPTCADMAPIYGYYFNGGFYPKGGTSHFSEVLADNFRRSGGEIVFKTGVGKILIEQGRAAGLVLDNGEVVRARAVVANSDPRKTFLELLDPALLPEKFREKLEAAKPAESGFGVHLGVDYDPEGKTLTFIGGEQPCLIARPGLIDPGDAPAGYASIDIFTLLTQEQAGKWFPPASGASGEWRDLRRSDEYLRRKEAFADHLIAQAEKQLPGLRGHIVYRSEASPVTYARYDRSSAGAIYGVAPQGRLKGSKSPIPGLVIAGSMNFGPGVEAAALSGVWAAEALVPGLLAAPATVPAPQGKENEALVAVG